MLIPHSHGNGLVIGGVYLRYMHLMGSRIIVGSMDIRTKVYLAAQSPWTMRCKIVIPHGLGLLPEYNYLALASPQLHIIFWLPSSSLGYNYYIYPIFVADLFG